MQDLRHKRELLIMKLDLDYGYGINNVFWKSILDDCSEDQKGNSKAIQGISRI